MIYPSRRELQDSEEQGARAPAAAPRAGRDTLLRRLALLKLRELRREGMSYREIGLRYGSGAPDREPARRLPGTPRTGTDGREAARAAYLQPLELLDQGLVFFDRAGDRVHANGPATRLLESPEAAELLHAVHHFVDLLWAMVDLQDLRHRLAVREISVREIGRGDDAYFLRGSYLGSSVLFPGGCVVVSVERRPPAPLSRATLQGRYGLTPQESRIARLLVEGRSNAQIAARLDISPHTARHHTQSVLRKLDAHSRAEAAARLFQLHGLTPSSAGEWTAGREAAPAGRVRAG